LNEEGRVEHVARLAVRCGLFAEVLVVDDGSRDGTADAARVTGARVISHGRNRGKPIAMRTGLESTTSPVVCFLDADLMNVTVEHLASLVEPVVEAKVQATLAVFKGGRLATTAAQKISPMISGQRCLMREVMESFNDWESGYGIETAINSHLCSLGIKQRITTWHGASQVMKEEKWGLARGILARIRMYWQIFVAWLRSKFRHKLTS
jgi:hypothetical protein